MRTMKKILAIIGICFGMFIMNAANTLQHLSGDHENRRKKTCLQCLTSRRNSGGSGL
jgi:hypothetical protein